MYCKLLYLQTDDNGADLGLPYSFTCNPPTPTSLIAFSDRTQPVLMSTTKAWEPFISWRVTGHMKREGSGPSSARSSLPNDGFGVSLRHSKGAQER